jgi:hypothetical protein
MIIPAQIVHPKGPISPRTPYVKNVNMRTPLWQIILVQPAASNLIGDIT